MPYRSCRVAVIGAGFSGLVSARSLLRESHSVTVFDKSNRVGGTWVYTPDSESDPLSLNPNRKVVHSSVYLSLRTNLPRHVMSFSDYDFSTEFHGDDRLFPGHEEVLKFIEGFAENSKEDILGNVRFGVEVVRVKMGNTKNEWIVDSRRIGEEKVESEVFEAVVVCNGHHTVPRVAEIQGIEKWLGKQVHSHNYRTPEEYRDKIVVIIGCGPSAYDMYREIGLVAKEVHLASRSPYIVVGKLDCSSNNIWQHSMIKCVEEDGSVVFNDRSSHHVDIILHCTGYKYDFPFLDSNVINIDDNRVGPLYEHVFHTHLAPWLSFVGLLNRVMLFPVAELQATWIARALSGKLTLPSEEDMIASTDEYYKHMEDIGKPKRYTHAFCPEDDMEYMNWLATELGLPAVEEWRVQLFHKAIESVSSLAGTYRDTFDADYWIQQSQQRSRNRLSLARVQPPNPEIVYRSRLVIS